MTSEEAQQFVSAWRRVLMPWPTPHTDAQLAKAMDRSIHGLAVGPVVPLVFFVMGPSFDRLKGSLWTWAVLSAIVAAMITARFLSLRFSRARYVLEKSEIPSN